MLIFKLISSSSFTYSVSMSILYSVSESFLSLYVGSPMIALISKSFRNTTECL
nr:MAG TPA: hypothetical protein [Caudoviricetes sp.]